MTDDRLDAREPEDPTWRVDVPAPVPTIDRVGRFHRVFTPLSLAFLVACAVYDHSPERAVRGNFGAPVVAPIQAKATTPLARDAAEYINSYPSVFRVMSVQIRAGVVKDRAAAVLLMKSHSAMLADTLDATFARYTDANGVITNPKGLAGEFDAVSQSLGVRQ